MAIISIILIPSTHHDAGCILHTAALIHVLVVPNSTCLTMGHGKGKSFERRESEQGGGDRKMGGGFEVPGKGDSDVLENSLKPSTQRWKLVISCKQSGCCLVLHDHAAEDSNKCMSILLASMTCAVLATVEPHFS